ncbi:ATP-binding protein [Streptobacillus felis]
MESYNAILDRLLHHCNVININDRSYRVRDYYQE